MSFLSRIARLIAGCVMATCIFSGLLAAQNAGALKLARRSTPDSAEILRRSAEAYAHLSQFDVDSVTTAETSLAGAPATLSVHTHWTARGTTKVRLSTDSELGPSQSSSLVVADGENLWAYSTRSE